MHVVVDFAYFWLLVACGKGIPSSCLRNQHYLFSPENVLFLLTVFCPMAVLVLYCTVLFCIVLYCIGINSFLPRGCIGPFTWCFCKRLQCENMSSETWGSDEPLATYIDLDIVSFDLTLLKAHPSAAERKVSNPVHTPTVWLFSYREEVSREFGHAASPYIGIRYLEMIVNLTLRCVWKTGKW